MMKIKINKGKRIIKIIDTSFSSFVLEKIFEGCTNFDEIIEIKKDLRETKSKAKNILKISKKNFFSKNKFIVTCSVAFNLSRFKLLNFLKFHKLQKDIFKKISFNKNYIYIGSKTSTIMNILPRSNRIMIDHGFADYSRKTAKISIPKKIIDIIKEKITNYIYYPYISLNEDRKSYTVCKIPKFSNNFIDMQNLPVNKILKHIFIRIKKKYPRITTIFLLNKNWEVNYKKNLANEINYDSINLNLIKKYATKGEIFFIKYHGYTIESNQQTSSFIQNAVSLGYHPIDIDSFFKTCYRGLIPAELLIGRLKLKRIISKYSSTLHNVCHNKSLECIMDINPELELINKNSNYYKKKLLEEFNLRYSFNKSTGEKINIKKIHEQNF